MFCFFSLNFIRDARMKFEKLLLDSLQLGVCLWRFFTCLTHALRRNMHAADFLDQEAEENDSEVENEEGHVRRPRKLLRDDDDEDDDEEDEENPEE
jgi:hypothetical protein